MPTKLEQKIKIHNRKLKPLQSAPITEDRRNSLIKTAAKSTVVTKSKENDIKTEIIIPTKEQFERRFEIVKFRIETQDFVNETAMKHNTYSYKSGNTMFYHCGRTPQGFPNLRNPIIETTNGKLNYIPFVKGKSDNEYFAGLQHCNNSVLCFTCGAKIASVRIEEYSKAISHYITEKDMVPVFITLTEPHTINQTLTEVLDILSDTFRKVMKQYQIKYFKNTHEIEFIKALDITVGKNGWHAHYHTVWLIKNDMSIIKQFSKILQKHWNNELRKQNLNPNKYSYDMRIGDGNSEKLMKYLFFELYSTQTKTAHGTNLSFKELLEIELGYGTEKDTSWLIKSPGNLIEEYIIGIKGISPVRNSRNLFKDTDIKVKTDAEATTDDVIDEVIYYIDRKIWNKFLIKNKGYEVLKAYCLKGKEGVIKYLKTIPELKFKVTEEYIDLLQI